jgi:hypothetical protein
MKRAMIYAVVTLIWVAVSVLDPSWINGLVVGCFLITTLVHVADATRKQQQP